MGEALAAGRTENKRLRVVHFNWLLLRRCMLSHRGRGAEGGSTCTSELESRVSWRKSAKQIGRLTRLLVEALLVMKCFCFFWPLARSFLGQFNFRQVFFFLPG